MISKRFPLSQEVMAKPTTELLKKVVLLNVCKDVVFMAQRPYFYFPIHVKIYSLKTENE